MNNNKNTLQKDIVNAFCELENRRGLAILATGTGKTRIALLIAERLNPIKILYLTESTTNRDKSAPAEFKKWGMEHLLARTQFMTYQLAYKLSKLKTDLTGTFVIADEVDFAFTKEYGKFFKYYTNLEIFAITGFITEEKYRAYKDILPILINIPAKKMQANKILNKTKFIFVQYLLDEIKNIPITYKKDGKEKTFYTSEMEQYKYFQLNIDRTISKMMKAITEKNTAEVKKLENLVFVIIPRQRAAFLWTLKSSVTLTRELIVEILLNKNNKVITFSERTAQAEAISDNFFHGSMDKTLGETTFAAFQKGTIRELATCSKVNRGVNIEGLNYAILESYTTDLTSLHQRNGRLMRLSVDKEGIIYILLPYYLENNLARPTKAVMWARSLLKGMKANDANKELPIEVSIINKCKPYKILKE